MNEAPGSMKQGIRAIQNYLRRQPSGAQADLARYIGTSPAYMYQMLRGMRPITAERVIPLCRASGWEIRPNDLRPDVYPNIGDGIPQEQSVSQPVPEESEERSKRTMNEEAEKEEGQPAVGRSSRELRWRMEISTRIAERGNDSLEDAAKQVNNALAVLRQGLAGSGE